jgi:membrane associated rhomboid family serine protease
MSSPAANWYSNDSASGAVFGILLAFGMLSRTPVDVAVSTNPIKAKWFVIGYGLIILCRSIQPVRDNVAHFAHLGGMVFGLILILYWRKFNRKNFY